MNMIKSLNWFAQNLWPHTCIYHHLLLVLYSVAPFNSITLTILTRCFRFFLFLGVLNTTSIYLLCNIFLLLSLRVFYFCLFQILFQFLILFLVIAFAFISYMTSWPRLEVLGLLLVFIPSEIFIQKQKIQASNLQAKTSPVKFFS